MESLANTSAAEMTRVLNINVVGAANILRFGMKVMQKQRYGNITVVSSIAARDGLACWSSTAPPKRRPPAWCRAAQSLCAPYGVR